MRNLFLSTRHINLCPRILGSSINRCVQHTQNAVQRTSAKFLGRFVNSHFFPKVQKLFFQPQMTFAVHTNGVERKQGRRIFFCLRRPHQTRFCVRCVSLLNAFVHAEREGEKLIHTHALYTGFLLVKQENGRYFSDS